MAAPGRSATRPIPVSSPPRSAHWLPAGIVVASANYRLLPLAGPLQQAGDVARAIAFVQKQAASWRADPARLVVVGHSTGAHLAALLAADPTLAEAEGAAPWLATILLDSAALDVVELMRAPHRPLYDRAFGADEAAWQALSPLHRLRARPAPLLLVHSDRAAGCGGCVATLCRRRGGPGGRAEVHEVALSHAEINAQLGLGNALHRAGRCLPEVGGRAMTIRRWPAALLLTAAAAGALPGDAARSRRSKRCARAGRRARRRRSAGAEPTAPGLENADGAARKVRPAGRRARRARSRLRQRRRRRSSMSTSRQVRATRRSCRWSTAAPGCIGDKGNSGVVANKAKHWLPTRLHRGLAELPDGSAAESARAGGGRRAGRSPSCRRNAASWGGDGRGSCSWGTLPAPTS